MKKNLLKKMLSVLLCGVLTTGLFSGVVMADDGTAGSLTATLSMGESYVNGENINATLKLTNNYPRTLRNIAFSFQIPNGYSGNVNNIPDTIAPGQTISLSATIEDIDLTDVYVVKQKADISGKFNTSAKIKKYVVEPKKNASVKKGILKAKKEGDITVTAYDDSDNELGKYTAKIEKPVFKKYTADATTFNALDKVEGLTKAGPSKWSSSNEKVAKVNEKSGDVTLLTKGKAVLTAEFGTEKNAAKYKLKVSAPKTLFSGSSDTKAVAVESSEEISTEPADIEYTEKSPAKDKYAKVKSENTLSTKASTTVIIDGRKKDISITTDYEISSGNALDNLNDILAGGGDVAFDTSGNLTYVNGNFTNKKVTNESSAADVFNEIGVLFAQDTDHSSGIGGTEATADDITEYEDKSSGRKLYRYIPASSVYVEDESGTESYEKIPLVGSEVIITADSSSGEVKGLFSSFKKGVSIYSSYSFYDFNEDKTKKIVAEELLKEASISGLVEGDYESDKIDNLSGLLTLGTPEKVLFLSEKKVYASYKVPVSGTVGTGENALEIKRTAYISADSYPTVYAIEDLFRHDRELTEEIPSPDILGDDPVTYDSLPEDDGITVSYAKGDDNDARKAAAKKLLGVLKTTKNRYKGTLQEGIFNKSVKVKCVFGAPSLSAYWDSSDMDNLSLVFRLRNTADTNETELNSLAGHEFSHAMLARYLSDDENFLINLGETKIVSESYADIIRDLMEGRIAENTAETKYPDVDFSAVDTTSAKKVLKYAAYKMMSDDRTKDVPVETWKDIFLSSISRLPSDATLLHVRFAVICAASETGRFDNPKQEAVKEAFSAAGISAPDTIRISLTWGESPSDLDSHLVGPTVEGTDQFHVWYSNKNYTYNNLYAADLDHDDTSSYGPEITTIYRRTPGEYYFLVHDYSTGSNREVPDSTAMAASGAIVRLYYGDSDHKQQKEYHINPSTSGAYWTVFKLTIGDDSSISVEDMNLYYVPEYLRSVVGYWDEENDEYDE